jgi:hypothetical protein
VGALARPFDGGIVILNTSILAADAMLDAVSNLMDGGTIELLAANHALLVAMRMANPSADAAVDGVLELNEIAEGTAVATGDAAIARVLTRAGEEIFNCDVGPIASDATIKLTPILVTENAPVRLQSFKLVLP